MSDHEFDLELDGDMDSLYREGGEPKEEVRPVPSLPSLPSLPLEGGDDGPLYPDILLEEVSEDEPLSDPSSLLAPRSAEVELALQPVPINWAAEVGEPEVGKLLESTDSEEQQDQEDLQDLPSSGSSLRTTLMDGMEQVPELR